MANWRSWVKMLSSISRGCFLIIDVQVLPALLLRYAWRRRGRSDRMEHQCRPRRKALLKIMHKKAWKHEWLEPGSVPVVWWVRGCTPQQVLKLNSDFFIKSVLFFALIFVWSFILLIKSDHNVNGLCPQSDPHVQKNTDVTQQRSVYGHNNGWSRQPTALSPDQNKMKEADKRKHN